MKARATYADGPTTCRPKPRVLRNIRKQIKENRALSRGDIRLASAMGLIAADSRRPLGFNDGVFYPVDDMPARAARRTRLQPMARLSRTAPKKKTLHALALLVDFSDNKGKRPANEFERLLFDPKNADSMTSYYRELSRGALDVTGEVIRYIRAPKPYSFYVGGDSGTGDDYPRNTPGLLFDVLTAFCKTDSLGRFDVDGDGFVDGVFLIHAGGGAEAEESPSKRKKMIWSHKWTLPKKFTNKGVSVYAYSTEPEDGRVGVFAHEFGHVLGLPDLYDGTYRSEGIGDWCLMANGSWGGGGDEPCRMSAWCLAELGWITPKNVKKTATVTLPTLTDDATACRRLWRKGASGPEYFLLENRQDSGRDSALPGSGLAVWHVDETQTSNDHPPQYRVALVQADGRSDLEHGRNPGDGSDLFPGAKKVKKASDATPASLRANDGSATGIVLSDIAEKAGGVTLKIKI